jgi:hypothetical protein
VQAATREEAVQKEQIPASPAHDVKKVEISGAVALEVGQFVAGHHKQKTFEFRPWINREYAEVRFDADVGGRLHIVAHPKIKLWNNSYPITDVADRSGQPFRQYVQITLENAEGILTLLRPEKPVLQIAGGVFTYKYNPDARNLGEYLFRTGTHPSYIVTSFDYAHAILSGLHAHFAPTENLYVDAMLTTETQITPLFDWSLSSQAGFKLSQWLEIGAGMSLDRVFPAQGKVITTPINSSNEYLNDTGGISHYSFGGVKSMGRINFDLKKALPQTSFVKNFFGKEGGRIYTETAILGTENVTGYMRQTNGSDTLFVPDTSAKNYYNKLKDRIPVMFGVTVPSFVIFDVLAIEAEYYPWPYTNSYYDQGFGYENPTPKPAQSYKASDYRSDSWKWSVYAKKTIVKGFSVIAQFARDHTHHDIFNESQRDEEEVFTRNSEWGWWLKLQYSF